MLFEKGFYEDAVSRAYYAMHHAARAALAIEDVSPKTHSGLIKQFGEKIVKLGKLDEKTAKELTFGLEMRIKSDYSSDFVIDKGKVKELLQNSEDFVKSVSDYLEKALR